MSKRHIEVVSSDEYDEVVGEFLTCFDQEAFFPIESDSENHEHAKSFLILNKSFEYKLVSFILSETEKREKVISSEDDSNLVRSLCRFITDSIMHCRDGISRTLFDLLSVDKKIYVISHILTEYEDRDGDSLVQVKDIQNFIIGALTGSDFSDMDRAIAIQNSVLTVEWRRNGDYRNRPMLVDDTFEKELLSTITDPLKIGKELKIKLGGRKDQYGDLCNRYWVLLNKHVNKERVL